MRRLILVLAFSIALTAGIAWANHNPAHMEVTSSTVNVQSATVVQPSSVPLNPTAWTDIPIQQITATGRQFKMSPTCSAFNQDGTGPDYRYAVGVTVDGVAVGEARYYKTPGTVGYYETGSAAGSLREGVNPGAPSTHTFKLQAWGVQGSLAVLECNYTIEAYQ